MSDPAYAIDPTKSRMTNYHVYFNSLPLGGLDKVSPTLKLLVKPIKIGSFGEMKIGDRVIGLTDDSKVTVVVRELTRVMMEKALPWFNGTTDVDEIPLTPPIGSRLEDFGHELRLHPADKALSVLNEDLILYIATPMQAFNMDRDGGDEDKWMLEFNIYPDLTKLPDNPYGQIGNTPS